MKRFLILSIFLISQLFQAQQLEYKGNGNVIDSQKNKISPNKMRELLANNEKLLENYNLGRTKKTVGNVMLIGGLGFLVGVVAKGIFGPINTEYPSVLTYIGLSSIVLSIPVKLGFSKRIKNVISDYNSVYKVGYIKPNYKKLEIITNTNGIGLSITLN
jgi:hypothetical protein